jgi:hypothetical protein
MSPICCREGSTYFGSRFSATTAKSFPIILFVDEELLVYRLDPARHGRDALCLVG